jgi:hypothetical protein
MRAWRTHSLLQRAILGQKNRRNLEPLVLTGIGDASKMHGRSSADVHSGSARPAIVALGIGPK